MRTVAKTAHCADNVENLGHPSYLPVRGSAPGEAIRANGASGVRGVPVGIKLTSKLTS
jgi:hypothetical protein